MTPANSNESMRCESITVRLIWGPPVFHLRRKTWTESYLLMNSSSALSTLVQSYKLEEAIYLLLLRINNVNSIPRHVAEEDKFVSHHYILTEGTFIPDKKKQQQQQSYNSHCNQPYFWRGMWKFRQTLLFKHAHLEYLLFDLVQTPSGPIVDEISLLFGSMM